MSSKKKEKRLVVGLSVLVFKDHRVLLGKRKGAHGAGEYACPGGKLEYMESFERCAKREVAEEAGIKIANIEFVRIMNLKKYAPKHYVDIGLIADWRRYKPKTMEPHRCEGWGWYDIDQLPEPLFEGTRCLIEALKNLKYYFDN